MTRFTTTLLVWTLISPGSGAPAADTAWPTHTACRNEGLEVLYQSCDPLQDFGFSVDQCSKQLKPNLRIRLGIILREDIKELYLDISLISKGASVLNYSYPICEVDLPKFSFCGRKKGGKSPVILAACVQGQEPWLYPPSLDGQAQTHLPAEC